MDSAGLKDVYKDFNLAGDNLTERLRTFRRQLAFTCWGLFIFGLPSDRPEILTPRWRPRRARRSHSHSSVTPQPLSRNRGLYSLGEGTGTESSHDSRVPLTRRWLIPQNLRPRLYWDHPVMSAEEIRSRTQAVWDNFYSFSSIWNRSSFIKSTRGRLAFILISRIYRQMYADTGIATDSARVSRSRQWVRWLAVPCRHLFAGRPMPNLKVPQIAVPAFAAGAGD